VSGLVTWFIINEIIVPIKGKGQKAKGRRQRKKAKGKCENSKMCKCANEIQNTA
jgi:hypothetical protein